MIHCDGNMYEDCVFDRPDLIYSPHKVKAYKIITLHDIYPK